MGRQDATRWDESTHTHTKKKKEVWRPWSENDEKQRETDAIDGPNFLSRFQIRDDSELVEGGEQQPRSCGDGRLAMRVDGFPGSKWFVADDQEKERAVVYQQALCACVSNEMNVLLTSS
jgi:hypothetical protein